MAIRTGQGLLRGILAVVLVASGTILITKGDAQVAMVAAAIVSLMFGALFTYILRREVKVPHGEGVRIRHMVSTPWSRRAAAKRDRAAADSNGDAAPGDRVATAADERERETVGGDRR